jgi:type VI secretion system protein VasJ
MWIDTEVLPSVEATAPTEVVVKAVVPLVEGDAPSDDGHPDQVVAEARRLTAGGKFKDALSLLLEGLASASMRREQFLWKLRLAKLCLEAGQPRLALPQLQSLDDEIRQFSLEQWEPSLSVEVVRTLLQCQRKLMQDAKRPPAEILERTSELYARLCRLDVLSAVALDGGS